MVGKKNKNLTKYLTETRKEWSDGKCTRHKGLPKHMFILDVFDDEGEMTHRELFDSRCEQVMEILPVNIIGTLHQIDFIRLRYEVDSLESEIKKLG